MRTAVNRGLTFCGCGSGRDEPSLVTAEIPAVGQVLYGADVKIKEER